MDCNPPRRPASCSRAPRERINCANSKIMTDTLQRRFEPSIRAFVSDVTALVQGAALESVRAALDGEKPRANQATPMSPIRVLRTTVSEQRAMRDSYVTLDAFAAVVSTDGDNLVRRRILASPAASRVQPQAATKSKSWQPRKPKATRKARRVKGRMPKTVAVPIKRAAKRTATPQVEQPHVNEPLAAPI